VDKELKAFGIRGPVRSWGGAFLAGLASFCVLLRDARGAEIGDGLLVINGAGGAAYAITGNNDFKGASLVADPSGGFRNVELTLALAARISPQITISSQLSFEDLGAPATGLDWTFAEVRLANWLKLRAGLIKMPLGISGEVEAIGTLRPFYSLPDTVYGHSSIMADGYYGAGLTGEILEGPRWTLNYDLFGGQTTVSTLEPFARLTVPLVPGTVTVPDDDDLTGLIGGRLVLGTPIEGLSLRVSGYRGKLDDATLAVAMLSVEYAGDRWLVRAEAFRAAERTMNHGGYVEVAWFATPKVQLAVQVQGLRTHAPGVPDDSSLLWHASAAFGLNYWFAPNMVVKAAIEEIRGNRIAFPQQLDDALLAGNLSKDTPFFTLGTQFSF
jgi:hypothetical protein